MSSPGGLNPGIGDPQEVISKLARGPIPIPKFLTSNGIVEKGEVSTWSIGVTRQVRKDLRLVVKREVEIGLRVKADIGDWLDGPWLVLEVRVGAWGLSKNAKEGHVCGYQGPVIARSRAWAQEALPHVNMGL